MDEIYENNAFWLIGPNKVKEGPFCHNNECFHDNNDMRQRLTDHRNGSFTCPQCKGFVIVDQAKWKAYEAEAVLDEDRRTEEINRKFNF